MQKWLSNLHVPLRPTLVTAVIIAVILTGLGVGVPAYFNAVKATNRLWKNLSEEISNRSSENTLSYFNQGPAFLRLTQNLSEAGLIHTADPLKLLTYCASALEAHPHFYWVYYAQVDGSVFAAIRQPAHPIEAMESKILPHPENPTQTAFTREYEWHNEKWVPKRSLWRSYDPRTRPFWSVGLANPSGGWTKPYLFTAPASGLGITYVLPIYSQGKLQGMWMVDYFLDIISQYLRTLQISNECLIAIVTDQGVLVASSAKEGPSSLGATEPRNLGTVGAKDPLAQAWHALKDVSIASPSFYSKRFEIGSYLGYIQSFPDSSSVPWNVLTIIPKSFFFQSIIHQAWTAAGSAIALCLLCACIAALFFGSISMRLKKIALEMHKVGAFEISDQLFAKQKSLIREVNLMHEALDRMKNGLRSFASYVPIDLVSQLIQSGHPAEIGGQRQVITLLFADLANFTTLSEQETSEELIQVLGNYLHEMTLLIQAEKGTVDKYIGDGIMAFWGAPLSTTSHAVDACRAALLMQQKANTLWKNFKHSHHEIELSLRIGINTGSVIVGNFGSSERMNYTAVGAPVDLANRLEGLNKFYGTSILIGEETAKAVADHFLLRPITVSADTHEPPIYELVSEKYI